MEEDLVPFFLFGGLLLIIIGLFTITYTAGVVLFFVGLLSVMGAALFMMVL